MTPILKNSLQSLSKNKFKEIDFQMRRRDSKNIPLTAFFKNAKVTKDKEIWGTVSN